MSRTQALHIPVLGAGSWGSALAMLLARNGHQARLWGHESRYMERLRRDGENSLHLPGHPFPDGLEICSSLEAALHGADSVLLVVPSHAFRSVLEQARPFLGDDTPFAWATKGLEPETSLLLHEVLWQVLGRERPSAVVSGPTFATEVAAGLPAAVTVASESTAFAEQMARALHNPNFRAYTSDDVVGVEIGGAVKNVLALAAGIADGLGLGANTRAALITRGLAEMMRLGQALGCRQATFMGLAGLGDLALTCTDDQSRNRRMGKALGKGHALDAALAQIGQEVEGIASAKAVYRLAASRKVEMPICEQTYRVLYEGCPPREAVQALLGRQQKSESG